MSRLTLRKIALSLSVFAALTVCSAVTAKADPFLLVNGNSVTLHYATSNPNVTAIATYSLTGNVLTITVTNTSSVPSGQGVITGFGFSAWPDVTVASSSYLGAGSGWTYSTNGGGLGGLEHRFLVSGIGNGLNPGESGVGTMVLSWSPWFLWIDPNLLMIQGIPPSNDSEKPEGTIVIPEPATMILLGSGLIGISAAVRRQHNRRRSRD